MYYNYCKLKAMKDEEAKKNSAKVCLFMLVLYAFFSWFRSLHGPTGILRCFVS